MGASARPAGLRSGVGSADVPAKSSVAAGGAHLHQLQEVALDLLVPLALQHFHSMRPDLRSRCLETTAGWRKAMTRPGCAAKRRLGGKRVAQLGGCGATSAGHPEHGTWTGAQARQAAGPGC